MLASLGAQSRFANFFFSRSFCGLCNLADSFIKKIPVPGFSTSMSSNNLLEYSKTPKPRLFHLIVIIN
jgi:hypothetical protein